MDPEDVQARRGLALVYFERGDSEKTLQQGREAMRGRSENDVEALLTLGWSYLFGGLGDELGLKTMEKVLDLDPANQPARWALAVNFGGKEAGKEYIKRFGEDQVVNFYLGLDHLLEKEMVPALSYFEKVRAAGAESAQMRSSWGLLSFLYSGIVHQRLGDDEQASRDWELAVNLLEQDLAEDEENIKKQVLLACFQGLLNSPPFEAQKNLVLEQTASLNLIELQYLAGVLLKRGDTQEGHKLLFSMIERGRRLVGRSGPMIEEIIGRKFVLPRELQATQDRLRDEHIREYGWE